MMWDGTDFLLSVDSEHLFDFFRAAGAALARGGARLRLLPPEVRRAVHAPGAPLLSSASVYAAHVLAVRSVPFLLSLPFSLSPHSLREVKKTRRLSIDATK